MNTLGINFIVRRNSGNRQIAHLFARVTVNEEPTEISLKGRVDPDLWHSKKEEFNGKSEEVKAWNLHIASVRFRITQHFRKLEDKEQTVTAEAVKWAFEGKEKKKPAGHTVLELLDYHTKINPDNLKPGTMKNYTATRDYLAQFIVNVHKKEDYYLTDLDFQFITELENYIRYNPLKAHDPCTGNGVGKHMERFCKVVRLGRKLKWLPVYPFEDYKLKFTRTKVVKLSRQELTCIETQELTNPMLDYVRDLFLFSCYTGLAYCDVMQFSDAHLTTSIVGKMWIETYRQKSDELSPVPMLNAAIALVEKYRNDPRSIHRKAIFPYVTNQEVNRSIKIIAEICGIKKHMTFHKARHTFGTVVTLKNGVPLETVKQMMGHKKISTTMIYAEVDEEKMETDMNKVELALTNRKVNPINTTL